MVISGAVYADSVSVDRLISPLWLVPQPNNVPAMVKVGKCLVSLKKSVLALKEYYAHITPLSQPRYPSFLVPDKDLKYCSQIKPHLFKATLSGVPVIVKFTTQYCEELHKILECKSMAPKLLYFNDVTSQYKMVVVQELQDSVPINKYLLQNPESQHSAASVSQV